MSRPVSALFAVAAVALLVTACGETIGPERAQTRGPSLPTVAAPAELTEATLEGSGESYRFSFVVSPTGTTYSDGVNSIVFPAGAICELSSAYGPAHWDAPCTPTTKNVQFTVTLSQVNGVRTAMFSPDARFVPGKDVLLTIDAASLQSGATPTIYWTPDGKQLIDEAATDASLVPWNADGRLVRRIKHFSGYTVDVGFVDPCKTSTPPASCATTG